MASRSGRNLIRRSLFVLACAWTVGVLAVLGVGAAGASGPVFSDGFESGNLSAWTGSSGMTVQQSLTYAGSWAARATSNGSAAAYMYKSLAAPFSELWYDGRVRVVSEDSATNASLVRFRTSALGSILSMIRRGSDSKLSYFNEVTGVTTVGPVVSAGVWHELEVHVLINGSSSMIEVWLDGTRISALSKTDSLGTTPVGRIYVGDPSSGRTFDYAFDNELVSTSSDISTPSAPSGLTATAVGSLAVDLAWGASTDDVGVSGYTVYRNGAPLATVGGATTTYHDASVASGTTYTYTVDAFDAAGNHSGLSNAASVTPVSDVQAPSVPSGLSASAVSPTRVDLGWTGSTDNIGVTGYTIYRNGAQIGSVGGTTTSYSDTSTSPATQYSYTVDAFDAAANHSAASSPASLTTPSLPANTSAPTISGTAAVGQTLTAAPGTWSGSVPITYAQQWLSCDSNASNCSPISGATSQTYVPVVADVGARLEVAVTASNAYGSASASSAASAVVVAVAPANTSPPTISGVAQSGQQLTADRGQWTGTAPISYAYQWQSCNGSGSGCVDILPATSQTYTLAVGDVGSTVRVTVTASNSSGSSSASSSVSDVVVDPAPIAPSNTSPPTISGTTVVGQALSAGPGSWSGTAPISFAYHWLSCDSTGSNCTTIPGANAQSYTLSAGDQGTTLEVSVTATNNGGSSTANSTATALVTGPANAPANVSAPTISGTASVAQTLSADAGTWTGTAPISYAYQWRRCDAGGAGCADIGGATSSTYQLAAADLAATIRVAVTGSNSAGSSTAASAQTALVTDPVPPSQPTNLTATAIGSNRIDLSWTASTDNVGVNTYTIYRGGMPLASIAGTSTAYSDTTGNPSTSYTYTVDAADAAGNHSPLSAAASATTPPPADSVAPTVPTGVAAAPVGLAGVDVSWTGSTDNVGVVGYTIYRNGSVIGNTDAGGLAYSDLTTSPNTTYSYTVDAFDAAGNHSAQSTSATLKTPGPVFSDGFESGNLSQWTGSSGMTVQQSLTYAGSWAARATSNGGAAAYMYKSLAAPLSELWYDGRVRVVSEASATNASLVRFRTSAVGSILSIIRRGSDSKLSYSNEVTGVTTVGPVVSAGVWHELEVHVLINGSSGMVEVWLDGTKISALSKTDSLGTTPVGRIYVGDPASGRTFDYAFDNELVSTANDVTAPTAPTGLAATPLGSGRLNITWNAATDNNQVAGYTVYRNGAAVATLGPNTRGYADTGLSPSTGYSYTVDAFDATGNRSSKSTAAAATTNPAGGGDPVIATAGDIACDPIDSRFNGGAGTATACHQMGTGNILFNTPFAAVLPLGDTQYELGAQSAFLRSYDASWGRVNGLAHPVPGNHEYETTGAAGYYAYFGSLAGDPTKGYYSYDIGAWHIIALNGECSFVGGCGTGSPQEVWLRSDLAAHTNTCTLAYWHEPRFSSGLQGGDDTYATWWHDLYTGHADVVLNGHDHDYERFAPQDDARHPTPNGIRAFVVGTGGEEHQAFTRRATNSEVFNNDTFGVLQLTLHPTSYDWRFVPEAGSTFTDAGSTPCS